MKKSNNLFRKNKIARALMFVTSLSAISSGATNALENSQVGVDDEDTRITITGSRIKRTDMEGANPVTTITRNDLAKSSATNLGEYLQTLPSANGSPLGTKTNNGGNGAVAIDLRGMGAARTLTLINGKRVVDQGDLQTVPLTLVERVEVLKDGASAIYGADAVAGVINVITRQDFEGAELTAEISDYQDLDDGGRRARVGLISGINSDKGNITWGFEWDEQESIFQGDTKYDIYNYPLFVGDDETYTSYRLPRVGEEGIIEFGSSRNRQGAFTLGSGGPTLTLIDGADGTSVNDFRPAILGLSPGNDLWNYAPGNYIQTPFERFSFFASANYNLDRDMSLYMRLQTNSRESETLLAPLPYDTNLDPGFTLSNGGQGVSADNFYNPFGEDVIRVRRRMLEAGGRRFLTEVNQYQATVGLTGLLWDGNWEYDINMTSGERTRVDTDFGQFAGDRLQNSLGPSFVDSDGELLCGTPGNVISGCVPLNLFGGENSVTEEMLGYVTTQLNDRFDSSLFEISASISGDLVELPAGDVGVSFGIERRDEYSGFVPDSGKTLGTVTGGTASPSEGRYQTETFFLETVIPLLADVVAAKSLELDIGLRYDDNSLFGDQSTFQAGIRWQPLDGLLIRATSSDVFRAPSIGALFNGQSQGATPTVADPCRQSNWAALSAAHQSNCISQGVPDGGWLQTDTQLTQTAGGNPGLGAEEGSTKTFGIAWSPDLIEGLNVTLDWWEIELEGGIQSISAQNSMNLCASDLQFCDNITRDVAGVLGVPGAITNINAFAQNIASEVAQGIDLSINYSIETEVGKFKTNLLYSKLQERTQVPFVGGTPLELEGKFNPGLDSSFPENKLKLSTDWYIGQFNSSLSMDYISKLDVPLSFFNANYETKSTYYFDAQTTYTLSDENTKITFAISNLLDEDPVYIESGFNTNSDEATFRTLGRQFMLRASYSF